MPYNEQGEWVVPEGFEYVDQESLFGQVASGPEGMMDVVASMMEGNPDLEAFLDEGGFPGGETELYGEIAQRLTPWDPSSLTKKKRVAGEERRKAMESMYAQSLETRNLAAKGGFASAFTGATAQRDLWSEYLLKQKEITESLSSTIYKEKGDYLDSMFSEIAETWEYILGGE